MSTLRVTMFFERLDAQDNVLDSATFGARIGIEGPDLMRLAEQYVANTVTTYLPTFLEGDSK